jgi:hypothetical protein
VAFGDTLSLYTPDKPLVATYAIWHSDTTIQKRDDGADAAVLLMARSSSGEVYTASWHNGVPGHSIWVVDPVSGTSFFWWDRDKAKIVWVYHGDGIHSRKMQELLRKQPFRARLWAVPLCATYLAGKDEFTTQELGTSRIVDTDAQGIQATRNDQSVTEEQWFSPDLELMLTSRSIEPQVGTFVTEIKSLEQVEPDPNLFRVPAGYEVRDFPGTQSAN